MVQDATVMYTKVLSSHSPFPVRKEYPGRYCIVRYKSNSDTNPAHSSRDYGRAGGSQISKRHFVPKPKIHTKLFLAVEPEVANDDDYLAYHGYPERCGCHWRALEAV